MRDKRDKVIASHRPIRPIRPMRPIRPVCPIRPVYPLAKLKIQFPNLFI